MITYLAGTTYFYYLSNDTYQEIIDLNCTVNDDTVHFNEFYRAYGWVSSTPF